MTVTATAPPFGRGFRLGTPHASLVDRLAHEYGRKDELDGRSAVRPLALVREHGRTVLLFEDVHRQETIHCAIAPAALGQ